MLGFLSDLITSSNVVLANFVDLQYGHVCLFSPFFFGVAVTFAWVCASTLVMALVSVVLPWSTCPIVPTFTWGLLRSNTCFAIFLSCSVYRSLLRIRAFCRRFVLCADIYWCLAWSPHRGLNSGPHSYQECALPLSYVGPMILVSEAHLKLTQTVILVQGAGFEPAKPSSGRFTVCWV